MKTYKQLPIPEDTAWDRTTLFGRLHWRIRNFLTTSNGFLLFGTIEIGMVTSS